MSSIKPEDYELGLSEEQFNQAQERRRAELQAREGEIWAQPKRYFLIFGSAGERDAAYQQLFELKDYHDALSQLENWWPDPLRSDVGLQLNFRHGHEGLREELKALFAGLKYNDRAFQIVEDYAPDDPLTESSSKVVKISRREEPREQKTAA
jgi:hypothetical protein